MTQYQIQFKADGRWVTHSQYDSLEEAKIEFDKRSRPTRPWRVVKVITEVLEEKGGG